MRHAEDIEQRALCQWLDAKRVAYFAVPNGGKRSRIEACIMKGLGVKAGVPDLLIITTPPNSPYARGVAIEMKAPKGRMSPEQKVWAEIFVKCGWLHRVCYGWDEARGFLVELGY